jgi:hypothetical protein
VTLLHWLHFVFLAALAVTVAGLVWLARAYDRG